MMRKHQRVWKERRRLEASGRIRGSISKERVAKLKFEDGVRVWCISRRDMLTEIAVSTKHKATRQQEILYNYDIWWLGIVKFKVKSGRKEDNENHCRILSRGDQICVF